MIKTDENHDKIWWMIVIHDKQFTEKKIQMIKGIQMKEGNAIFSFFNRQILKRDKFPSW